MSHARPFSSRQALVTKTQLIMERQWLHATALSVLLALLVMAMSSDFEGMRAGMLWGANTVAWFWLAVTIAVVHQVYVWLCWRNQLHGSLLTRILGERAFPAYALGFSVLGISRVLVILALAISNRDTLTGDLTVLRVLAVLALIPALYLFYSVHRYFGFQRAFGIDHFDDRYRSLPFVRAGIFRFTRNGMYTCGFLLLWAIALWYASIAALCAAIFNHLYVWVHYYSTELPDMKRLYGEARATENHQANI